MERVIAQQAERGNKIDALLATLVGRPRWNTAWSLYESVLGKVRQPSAPISTPSSAVRTGSGSRTSSPRPVANPPEPSVFHHGQRDNAEPAGGGAAELTMGGLGSG